MARGLPLRLGVLTGLIGVGAACAAQAQGYADPPRAWTSGFGQGVIEANVRNNNGAQLSVACPVGSEIVKPGFNLEVARKGPATQTESLEAVIEIDGEPNVWSFYRRLTGPGDPVAYGADAINFRAEAEHKAIVAAMRRGRSVTIYIPPERVRETFTLAGSGAALDECD